MYRRPPKSTHPATLIPDTTLVRSHRADGGAEHRGIVVWRFVPGRVAVLAHARSLARCDEPYSAGLAVARIRYHVVQCTAMGHGRKVHARTGEQIGRAHV